jgi:hypothetical protein
VLSRVEMPVGAAAQQGLDVLIMHAADKGMIFE